MQIGADPHRFSEFARGSLAGQNRIALIVEVVRGCTSDGRPPFFHFSPLPRRFEYNLTCINQKVTSIATWRISRISRFNALYSKELEAVWYRSAPLSLIFRWLYCRSASYPNAGGNVSECLCLSNIRYNVGNLKSAQIHPCRTLQYGDP